VASASSLKQARGELVSLVGQTVQDTDAMTATVRPWGLRT